LSPLEWNDKLPQRWELPQNLGGFPIEAWRHGKHPRDGAWVFRITGFQDRESLLVALLVWSEPMKGAQFRFKPAANRTWSRQLPLGTKGELRLFYAF